MWYILTLVHFLYTLDICKCQPDRTVTIKTLHSELNKHKSYPSMCMSAVAADHLSLDTISCCWPFMINSWTYFMSAPSLSHYLHTSFNGKNPQFCAAASSQARWEKQSTRSPWSVFAGHLYWDISAICFHSTDLTNICFGFKANINCRHLRGSRFQLWA